MPVPEPSPVPFGLVARYDEGDGERTYSVRPSGWWATTSVIVMVAATRLLRGEVGPGVHAPEAFFHDAALLEGAPESGGLLVERTW